MYPKHGADNYCYYTKDRLINYTQKGLLSSVIAGKPMSTMQRTKKFHFYSFLWQPKPFIVKL